MLFVYFLLLLASLRIIIKPVDYNSLLLSLHCTNVNLAYPIRLVTSTKVENCKNIRANIVPGGTNNVFD